ncbi:MAG TPA: alpha/beta fold hydrolase [Gemmatimonadales bacterium]|nr:alpha/beta fold hydrolase [Gemmatimonadales bacterium]
MTLASAATAQALPADSVAGHFVDLMAREAFADATAMMNGTMLAAVPEAKLREIWQSLTAQVGAYQKRGAIRMSHAGGYDVALVATSFAASALDVKVVLDSARRVSGLFFQPAAPPPTAAGPLPEGLSEREVTVGAQGWPLKGTLTLPKGEGRFPLVILVHGSGPHDRNETIGPNTPFKDLAYGLAQRGVAVLRYEKRTLAYGQRIAAELTAGFTVDQETIADALAAVDSARHLDRIDPARIYVAGHSLGGYLVPRIVAGDHRLAGAIALAGSTRHLEDMVIEQLDYLAAQDGGDDKSGAAQREMLRNQAQQIKALTPADSAKPLILIGAPPNYWLDLKNYDPVKLAESQSTPLLILQGGRDYQVTSADLARWQQIAGRKGVTIRQYPALNHLFMAGTGPSTPAEYARPGHVDEQVIIDIAGWITQPAAPRP